MKYLRNNKILNSINLVGKRNTIGHFMCKSTFLFGTGQLTGTYSFYYNKLIAKVSTSSKIIIFYKVPT